MIEAVTFQRWLAAQKAEFPQNPLGADSYNGRNNALFSLLDIDKDQQGKTIVEIGCGPQPVTSFCTNVNSILIEPLGYEVRGTVLRCCAEDVEFYGDEAWVFNCLQHVRDPEFVIQKCQQLPVVRFFEPIDYPKSLCHPHTMSFNDFERWFGKCVKYFDGTGWPSFHNAPCAYGIWRKL